jgi:hypothetical protein
MTPVPFIAAARCWCSRQVFSVATRNAARR